MEKFSTNILFSSLTSLNTLLEYLALKLTVSLLICSIIKLKYNNSLIDIFDPILSAQEVEESQNLQVNTIYEQISSVSESTIDINLVTVNSTINLYDSHSSNKFCYLKKRLLFYRKVLYTYMWCLPSIHVMLNFYLRRNARITYLLVPIHSYFRFYIQR